MSASMAQSMSRKQQRHGTGGAKNEKGACCHVGWFVYRLGRCPGMVCRANPGGDSKGADGAVRREKSMNTKQYVEQVRAALLEIKSMKAEVEMLSELAQATGGFNYSQERVTGSAPQSAKFEDAVVKLVYLQATLIERMDELVNLIEDIRDCIEKVEDPLSRVALRYRHLLCKDVDEVAELMQCDRRTIYRKLDQGYVDLAEIAELDAPAQRKMPARDRHAESRRILREVYGNDQS